MKATSFSTDLSAWTGLKKWLIWTSVSLLGLILLPIDSLAQKVVLKGGWLFDSTRSQMVPNNGIIVEGEKFLEVGARLSDSDLLEAEVLDLGEQDYLLPGIFDLHAHYGINLFGRLRRDEHIVNPVIFLANGVTSTFPAGESNPTRMLETRKRINSNKQIGPRIFNSGPYFGTARPGWDKDTSAENIDREIDFWAALGVKGFKAEGVNREQLYTLIQRAHLHGLTVTGHLGSGYQDSVNPTEAILMGIDRIEHFLGGDSLASDRPAHQSLVEVKAHTPEFRETISLYIKHRVYFNATLSAYGYSDKSKEEFDHWVNETQFFTPYVQTTLAGRPPKPVNEQFGKIYRVKRQTVKAFYDAGGLITLGSDHISTGDYLAGFSAHRELHALVLSGIPPAAAIKIATLNGARALKMGDQLGSIESGKLADLLVVRGNPLEDIRNTRNVRLVMKSGHIYDPAKLLNSVRGEMGPKTAAEAEHW